MTSADDAEYRSTDDAECEPVPEHTACPSEQFAGFTIGLASGTTVHCFGAASRGRTVALAKCSTAAPYVFSRQMGQQYLVHPRGREAECLSFTEGTSCELIVEPCAVGYHRRQLWLVDTMRAGEKTTLKNRKTGTCATPHSAQVGAKIGAAPCGASLQEFKLTRAD